MTLAIQTAHKMQTKQKTNWAAVLGLAALLLPALATPARAQVSSTPATPVFVPNSSNAVATGTSIGPVPFSWLQFKQNFGLPGAPTVPQYPSFNPQNTNAYTYPAPNVGGNYAGDYIRAYLLGDYAGAALPPGSGEPPGGFNNFFDTILGLSSGLVAWTAPDVNYGAASVTPIIVDDNNNQNASTLNAAATGVTTIYGYALADAGWSDINSATAAPNNIPANIQNYYADSYARIPAISRAANETLTNGVITGYSGNDKFFHWYPNVTTPGAYTAYAWFPSQNATVLIPHPSPATAGEVFPAERHVTDAQYQILINGFVVQTVTVDQQSGGTWVPIGSPFYYPAQSAVIGTTGAAGTPPNVPNGYTGTPNIEIRLNNTTKDPTAVARPTVGGTTNANDPYLDTYVVADAVQLRGEDGSTTRMVSSPVSVNKTDYPELFAGYSIANYPDYSGVGGLHPEYQQAHLVLSGTNGTTGTVTAGATAAALIDDTFSGTYPTAPVVAPTNGGVSDPIDQLVYFTRDETIVSPADPTAVQTVGAVYCVDGRNGNVVWRYPSSNPVTVNDTDTTNFTLATLTPPATASTSATAYPPPNGGQYYAAAAAAAGSGTTFATWTVPAPVAGAATPALYQVYVWNPSPAAGEVRPTNAVYSVNGATCVVDQTTGGQFVPLTDINGNTTFTLTPGTSTVTLSTGVYAGTPAGGAVVVANAVEFVPADSLGTIDSTPAIVRNMRVLTVPGATDKWETRTVVVVADNLGKVYALDAAGNEDGNDTLLDATGTPVSFNADGTTAPTGTTYTLPYTPKHYGTTRPYWIWQPNPSSVTLLPSIVDNSSPAAPTAGQPRFTVGQGFTTTVTTPVVGPPAVTNAFPPPAGTALSDPAVAAATAPVPPDYVTWSPLLPTGTTTCFVDVWFPTDATATTTANYTIVDGGGAKHSVTVNQSVGGGGWFRLPGTYAFTPTTNPPPAPAGYQTTPNTIVLDNTTANAADVGKTVYADAVRVEVIAASQLVVPLAFQMCSPTVALKNTTYATYGMTVPTAGTPPTNDATIYIGNSNGVMYSLEGGGVNNTFPVPDIRRNATLDPNTPTVGVNWWFSFGGLNSTDDIAGTNTLATTYAPAYDPYDGPTDDVNNPTVPDGLLFFTTFSPPLNDDSGPSNQGYLFAVDAKYGPFGDGGDTGGAYNVADPTTRVGTQKYNVNPVPYWTFPDKFGSLVADNSIYHNGVAPTNNNLVTPLFYPYAYNYNGTNVIDHLRTSGLPAVSTQGGPLLVPAANPVGDAAGAPIVYTASVSTSAAADKAGRRVYFGANDANTPDPVSGRVYGIDPMTGKIDPYDTTTGRYPFIYPSPAGTAVANITTLSPLANPFGDPNLIGRTDQTTLDLIYNGYSGTGTDYNTSPTVPNAFSAFTDQDASTGYFVSTSPVAAPITFPTLTASLPTSVTTAQPNGPGIVANQTVQMMYVADLSGYMHYINLNGNPASAGAVGTIAADLPRDVYDYQVGDSIISTPALLPNASGAGYTTPEPAPSTANPPTGNRVGGALFVTTQGGNLVELEAFPTVDPVTSLTAVRLKDWTYNGPGGYSSPAVAAFNTTNVTTGAIDLGDSEWVYVGGDQGTFYGFTPNNTSANGGNGGGTAVPTGAPGGFVPPNTVAPPATVPPNRNFVAQVTSAPPPTSNATPIPFDPANGPPKNPAFDWGQTAYIEIFGIDQSNPAQATITTPKAIRIQFQLRVVGRAGRGLRTLNKVIDLQSQDNTTLPKNVYPAGAGWPTLLPTPGAVLTTSAGAATATGTVVGPNVAVYAYQLNDGSTDPQTPGGKIQIANIVEQAQYLDTTKTPPQIKPLSLSGTSDVGSLVRKAGGAGTGLSATTAIDEGTFSILNPLAVRGAGRSLGTSPVTYYNLTLTPQGRPSFGGLGPFGGVDSTSPFSLLQAALSNGNSILASAPVGGTITTAAGTIVSSAANTLAQIQQPKQFQAIVATDAGLISHGTNGQGATPSQLDPSSVVGGSNASTPPTTAGGGDYGEALFDIADRSALGAINDPITRLRMNNPTIGWNDNTETGNGAGAVINPLPWDQLPQAYYVSGRSSSPDYPDIGSANTTVELLMRKTYSAAVDATLAPGSHTYVTSDTAVLSASDTGVGSARTIYPNAAMVHVAIPRYQPANLESYPFAALTTGTGGGFLAPGVNHADTTNQLPGNVAEGYVARSEVFIDTRNSGRRDRTEAYRSVQVWTGVPADTKTSVSETTVDIGSVPAGFGLYGTNGPTGTVVPNNDYWSPLIPGATVPTPSAYASFFKPITIINDGNVNLMNVHLDQRILGPAGVTPYLPFQSDTVNFPYGLSYPQSLVPSSDYGTAGSTVTGTPQLPLVRSNLDYFDENVTYSNGKWNYVSPQPQFNTYVPNSLLLGGVATSGLVVPGPTLHKPRPGDPQGSVMTVPDTPHNNYPTVNGSVLLANAPYKGRPVVSMAIPLATPVGTYSSTIKAFEGYDPTYQQYQGPTYAGTPVTALSNWAAMTGLTPVTALTTVTSPLGVTTAVQTTSDPGTTLRATVVESRLTDDVPLRINSTATAYTSAVLPMVDSITTTGTTPTTASTQTTPNSNDIQPWGYYDPAAGVYGLLWTTQRGGSVTTPYSIYGTGLTSLITPTNMSGTAASWWSAPVRLTETGTPAPVQSSSNPSVVASVTAASPQTALAATMLWVTAIPGATAQAPVTYQLNGSGLTYTTGVPAIGTIQNLAIRTTPIFGPRGAYISAGSSANPVLASLTVPQASLSATTPTDPAPGNTPLIVWSTRAGGRSQIFYWPSVKADPANASKVIVGSGVLPVPADLRSVANPTIVARVVSVSVNGALTPVSAVDVTYTGVSAATGQSDVYTSRYIVDANGNATGLPTQAGGTVTVTSLTLTLIPSLPLASPDPAVLTTGYLPTQATATETLASDGQGGFQSRDNGWIRDPSAFELDVLSEQSTQTATGSSTVTVPVAYAEIVPSAFFAYLQKYPNPSTRPIPPKYQHSTPAVYDRSSGQWIFTINWSDLNSFYTNNGLSGAANLLVFANWLYGTPSATALPTSNLIVYTNPAAGTVRLGVPLPKSAAMTTSTSGGTITSLLFYGLQASFNPQAQRVTFQSSANVASIAFIDEAAKTNAAPYVMGNGVAGQTVQTSRYWYLYRKAGVANGNAAATSSVLYYRTRRLTVVLPTPIPLTAGAGGPYVAGLTVSANGTNITSQVDIDWARGRLYFPDVYEGAQITVNYTDAINPAPQNAHTITAFVTWQDEPQANDTAGNPPSEHVIPITNAVNESDPCAFLNPSANAAQTTGTNQSTAHSVWLFWSSSRNANALVDSNNAPLGKGADLYWETIDPRFEVVLGP